MWGVRAARSALRALVALAVALAFAGCGDHPGAASGGPPGALSPSPVVRASAPPPSAVGAASASPRAATSVEPSVAPDASVDAPAGPGPSVPHADPALEAVLPDRIGDAVLTRLSVPGTALGGGGDMCVFVCPDEPRQMATAVGATVEDMTLAVAYETRDNQLGRYLIVAFRVRGSTGTELLAGRKSLYPVSAPYPMVEERLIAGRMVTIATLSWMPNSVEYLVVAGDALIHITAATPEQTSGAFVLPEIVTMVVAALP